jgi:hypothetical protein
MAANLRQTSGRDKPDLTYKLRAWQWNLFKSQLILGIMVLEINLKKAGKKMRKIIVLVGIFTILGIGGFIGKAIDVNATSKVELEDIVMKQQADIESLKSQLSDTTKRLEALESKQSNTDQFDTRLTHLENSIGAWNTNKTVKQLIDDTNNTLSN